MTFADGHGDDIEIAVFTSSNEIAQAVLKNLETTAALDRRPSMTTRRGLGGGAEMVLVSGVIAVNSLSTVLRALIQYIRLQKITSINARHTTTESEISIQNPRPEDVQAILQHFDANHPVQDNQEQGELPA